MKHKQATFAIFKNRNEIRMAIRSLLRLGFKDQDLVVLQPVQNGSQDFPQVQKNQILNGTIFGAILGAFIGGCLYLFVGPGLDSHAVGVNSSIVAQGLTAFVSVLLGLIGGAACGALVGIGTPKTTGQRYGQYMHSGGILLSVESESTEDASRAENILLATGGQDVHVADEKSTWNSAIQENSHISKDRSKNRVEAYS